MSAPEDGGRKAPGEARRYDLAAVTADGWFERVLGSVPALVQLCNALGEPLVALSLAAGVRILSAAVDPGAGVVRGLQWARDEDGLEQSREGSPETLRAEVMALLLAEGDPALPVTHDDPTLLREAIGLRTTLLAPLFGLRLLTLHVGEDETRITVAHDRGEETVSLRQLRRFLRSRAVEALQPRGRGFSIDLGEVALAREELAAGRHEAVVARLGTWITPLTMYLRSAEGQSMPPAQRAELARALGVLGASLEALGRADEAEEVLRLGTQWALDGEAAPDAYGALALCLVRMGRRAESIGLLRRALTFDPARVALRLELGKAYLASGRAVAALGVVRALRRDGVAEAALHDLDAEVHARLGEALVRYEAALVPAP